MTLKAPTQCMNDTLGIWCCTTDFIVKHFYWGPRSHSMKTNIFWGSRFAVCLQLFTLPPPTALYLFTAAILRNGARDKTINKLINQTMKMIDPDQWPWMTNWWSHLFFGTLADLVSWWRTWGRFWKSLNLSIEVGS